MWYAKVTLQSAEAVLIGKGGLRSSAVDPGSTRDASVKTYPLPLRPLLGPVLLLGVPCELPRYVHVIEPDAA